MRVRKTLYERQQRRRRWDSLVNERCACAHLLPFAGIDLNETTQHREKCHQMNMNDVCRDSFIPLRSLTLFRSIFERGKNNNNTTHPSYVCGHILLYLSLTRIDILLRSFFVLSVLWMPCFVLSWTVHAHCIFTVSLLSYIVCWIGIGIVSVCACHCQQSSFRWILVLMKTKLRCVKKFCTINFIYCCIPFRLSFVTLISSLIHISTHTLLHLALASFSLFLFRSFLFVFILNFFLLLLSFCFSVFVTVVLISVTVRERARVHSLI